jgi:predicted esterase YcpF (UPF0227 family)
MPPRNQSERQAVLEEQLNTLKAEVREMKTKLDEVHSVLLQAKGARWAIIGVAGLAGFLSAKIAPLFSWVIHTNGSGVVK